MPKRIFCLLGAFLLLGGCAGRSHNVRNDFLRIRSEWLTAEPAELRASLRADYGMRVYDYVLHYAGNASGGTLTVEEPAILSGVGVELGSGSPKLHYDGLELDTGAVLGEWNPVQCFPLLLESWASAAVTECWEETRDGVACLVAEFDLTAAGERDQRLCRTWFDAETHAPVAAEYLENGRTVLLLTFSEG